MRDRRLILIRLSAWLFLASCIGACTHAVDDPPAPISSVVISAPDTAVLAGQSIKFVAEGISASGEHFSNRTVIWSSSDSSKATASADGAVTGKTEGRVTITATIESSSATQPLRVLPTLGVSETIGARGRLLFSRDGRIVNSKYDGSDIRYLTPIGAATGQYTVSADGNWIVSAGGGDLFVMKTDGTSRTKIASNIGGFLQPSWTPDANAVVVEEPSSSGDLIVKYSRDGVRLSSFLLDAALKVPSGMNRTLLRGISGDGSRALLWRQPDENTIGAIGMEVYTVNLDGTQLTLIGHGSRPRFSPDGKLVLFECEGVCLVNTDGSASRKVWNQRTSEAWISPNNQRLVFTGCGSLCVTTIEGVIVTQIANLPSLSTLDIAWFPTEDGFFFACHYVSGGGNSVSIRDDICRINIDGTNFVNLFNDSNSDVRPSIVETTGQAKH